MTDHLQLKGIKSLGKEFVSQEQETNIVNDQSNYDEIHGLVMKCYYHHFNFVNIYNLNNHIHTSQPKIPPLSTLPLL